MEEGVTGFTFRYDEERDYERAEQIREFGPAEIVAKAAKLDRGAIREIVETKWSVDQMAKNYERVYREQLAKYCADD